MYDVGEHLPIGGLEPGSTLLVVGPPMTGKRLLSMRLLAEGFDRGEAAALVSTDSSAPDIRASVADVYGESVDSLPFGVVDCVGEMGSRDELGRLDRRVGSPADLTGIGMELTDLMETLYDEHSAEIRVGLLTLTTMSMYASPEQVVRFLHVMSARITEAEGLGVVVAHSDTMEQEHLQQLRSFVDGVVEVRETADGSSELRVVGLESKSTAWVPLDTSQRPSPTGTGGRPTDSLPAVDVPDSLAAVLEAVKGDTPTLTITNFDGAAATLSEIERYFDRHNVTVRQASLDVPEPRSVALLHHGDDLLGAETVTVLRNAIELESADEETFGSRRTPSLLDQLDQSVFGASAADKSLLIDVSHTIEMLAERNGGGRLHAGFQQFSRLADDDRSARIYRRLSEAGTSVTVYGIPDAELDLEGVRARGYDTDEIAESWFVVYDGDGDPAEQAALLAIERDDSSEYDGFWTYESDIVRQLDAYLRQTYAGDETARELSMD